jgi:hypothetical protein
MEHQPTFKALRSPHRATGRLALSACPPAALAAPRNGQATLQAIGRHKEASSEVWAAPAAIVPRWRPVQVGSVGLVERGWGGVGAEWGWEAQRG